MTEIKNNGLWDWEGRIARLPYFLIVLATAVCGGILSVPLEHGASAWLLVLLVPIFYISVLAAIKRSHDVGLSGWYWWLSLVPLANLIFGLYLLFKAGDAGVNRYGPSPIDRSTADATPPPTNSAKATHVAVEPRRPTSIEPETHSESATSPMTKSPMPAQETLTIDEDAIYAAIAKELDTGATDKGLWTRLFAECDGDENKTKVAYIKHRAERIRTLEQGQIAAVKKQRDEEALKLEQTRLQTEFLSDLAQELRFQMDHGGHELWLQTAEKILKKSGYRVERRPSKDILLFPPSHYLVTDIRSGKADGFDKEGLHEKCLALTENKEIIEKLLSAAE